MLPEKQYAVGARSQMDKRTYVMITAIFITWAAILLIVKHNNSNNYIILEDESVLNYIK